MKKLYIIGAISLLAAGCKPSVDITKEPTAGDAVFSYYMAIGNSLTAGFADNSLYVSGQVNSYPQRLFEQFQKVRVHGAEGNFIQPLLHSDNGYGWDGTGTSITDNRARLVLGWSTNCYGKTSLAPMPLPTFSPDAADASFTNPDAGDQLNNIAVPGIRVADYPVDGYGNPINGNPYATRFYHDVTKSPFTELSYRISRLHPTFFTLWLGANDVLGYATAGGQGDGSGSASPIFGNYYSSTDITPPSVFQHIYDSIVSVVIGTGAKGALINIPDVTSIPFFTTVPVNGLYLSRQTQVDSLDAFYRSKNYKFHLGYNNFIVQDNAGVTRQAVDGELILLNVPQDSISCYGWGSVLPIKAQYVLTTDEIQNIKLFTDKFNSYIAGAARRNNLALIDMHSYMASLKSGMVYSGVTYTTQFVTGGAFSLDGVHPTPRGYALIANEIIKGINAQYHSTINYCDPNKYDGVRFP